MIGTFLFTTTFTGLTHFYPDGENLIYFEFIAREHEVLFCLVSLILHTLTQDERRSLDSKRRWETQSNHMERLGKNTDMIKSIHNIRYIFHKWP